MMRDCAFVVAAFAAASAFANEPNNTFGSRTFLSAGTLSVSDEIGSVRGPDTVVGTLGLFGGVDRFDDNNSPFGDGFASAIYGAPIDTGGSFQFYVGGAGDNFLIGDHFESGPYRAFVTVYDFFDDKVDEFFFDETLVPGVTEGFGFSDFSWFNGSFDVEIDNTAALSSDVDFFTFTGLTPGQDFTAETTNPNGNEFGIDTILGWFDDSGLLIDSNDQANGFLSEIEGVVPESGQLTFAVTAFNDFTFTGDHGDFFEYGLELSFDTPLAAGDFNGDGFVDNGDLSLLLGSWGDSTVPAEWINSFDTPVDNGELSALLGDWGFGVAAVPEPASAMMLLAVVAASTVTCRRA